MTCPSRAGPLLSGAVHSGQVQGLLYQGAHSSTVCPGFPPGSLFIQGRSPGHQISLQRYSKTATMPNKSEHLADNTKKLQCASLRTGVSINKLTMENIRLFQSLLIIIQCHSMLGVTRHPSDRAHARDGPDRRVPFRSCHRRQASDTLAYRCRRESGDRKSRSPSYPPGSPRGR